MKKHDYEKIVKKYYIEFLHREPDPAGLNHYIGLLEKHKINEKKLIEILKDSTEYKLSHPIEIANNTPIDIRMKKETINPLGISLSRLCKGK